ncbi:MAG: Ig-like domain-containing protein [Prevotellaceae bacterium]|jgi:uncharacterized protein (TIGR02145 family)|nr:Ig-like domain-containing protein [Prevotellaceae bacterium]
MKKVFLRFAMFVAIAAIPATVMVSCGDDKDEPKKETPTDPSDPTDPTEPTDPTDTVPVIPIDTVPQTIAVTSISLDSTSLTLIIGEDYTLTATVLPDNATDKTVDWQTSDATKATVAKGKVTAIAAGSVIITAKAGDKTATCAVTIKDPATTDAGVIINGVKWATRNIDEPGKFAATAESAGKFYQWNSQVGWSSTAPIVSTDGSTWDSSWNGNNAAVWETANNVCPAGWRVPTLAEHESLAAVGSEWNTVNGQNGRTFGTVPNTLFLPAAGTRYGPSSALFNAGAGGYYWSSTVGGSTSSYSLFFASGSVTPRYNGSRGHGLSVRCVAE